MKLLLAQIALCLAMLLGSGCSSCSQKPSEAECRAAIVNLRKILGLDRNTGGVDIYKAIRSCRGSSSKETAHCLAAAKTEADLAACEGDVGKKYLEQEREAERKRREKAAKNKGDDSDDSDKSDDGEQKDGE